MNDTAIIVSIIVGVLTILAAIIKAIRELIKMRDSYKRMAERAGSNEQDIKMLTKASLAILDGLKQLNCNGEVTKMHQTLLGYIVDK